MKEAINADQIVTDCIFAGKNPREGNGSLLSQVPETLKPHVDGYLVKLCDLIEKDEQIQPLVMVLRKASDEISQYQNVIDDTPPTIVDHSLKAKRAKIAGKSEPSPKTIGLAIGKLARTALGIFPGIKLPRPDLEELDKEIDRQRRLQQETDTTALQIAKDNLGNAIAISKEATSQILAVIDQRFCQNPTDTLIHLCFNPDRIDKIFNAYCQRAIENPTKDELYWMIVWISHQINQYRKMGEAISQRTLSWFTNVFEFDTSESVERFATSHQSSVDAFGQADWTYLVPITQNETMVKIITGTLARHKTDRLLQKELQRFPLWALMKSARNLGIIPSPKNGSPIIESIICPPSKEQRKQRRETPQKTPILHRTEAETKKASLTISIDENQLEITSPNPSSKDIAQVFRIDEYDKRIPIFIDLLSELWKRVSHDSLNIKGVEGIESKQVRERWGGQHKWKKDGRLGDFEVVLLIEGNNGTRKIYIKAIGTHEEIFGKSNH